MTDTPNPKISEVIADPAVLEALQRRGLETLEDVEVHLSQHYGGVDRVHFRRAFSPELNDAQISSIYEAVAVRWFSEGVDAAGDSPADWVPDSDLYSPGNPDLPFFENQFRRSTVQALEDLRESLTRLIWIQAAVVAVLVGWVSIVLWLGV